MKAVLLRSAFVAVLALAARGAEHQPAKPAGEHAAEGSGHAAPGGHGGLEVWKWANFALLAGVLGWVIKKNAGPWFDSRSREIRKQLAEAQALHAEAERKTREIEQRLAALQTEIDNMRSAALAEAEAEGDRVRRQISADMAKIQEHARQEMEAAGKQARLDLRRYSAALAVAAAEGRIRAGMTPGAQDALVDAFVDTLARPSSRAQTT